MTANQSRKRLPTSSERARLYPGLVGALCALLLLTACTRARSKDELPRVVSPSSGLAAVAMPVLPTRSPAPCTTSPPETLTASPVAGNRYDDAAARQAQQYLEAHPDDAGSLIVNVTVPGTGLYAGFVSHWCQHLEALRRLLGKGTRVEAFAVVQTYRAGQALAGRIAAATEALRRAGVRIGTTGVDPRTGLTSVTSPNHPADARAAILRELELPANAPIMVSYGDLPAPATR
jgi:hypothetical protein